MNKIIVNIKLTEGQLGIPIPAEHLLEEEISKIARIDACIWNEDIMVIIDVPLVSRETYRFYKMQPLLSQQYIQGKPLGLAAVRPRNTFLEINEQGTTHFKFNQEDLIANCIHRHYAWVCEAFVPLRSVMNEMDCEVTLLTKHEMVSSKHCKIKITRNASILLQFLTTSNTWLYMMPSRQKAKITCPAFAEHTISLDAVGKRKPFFLT